MTTEEKNQELLLLEKQIKKLQKRSVDISNLPRPKRFETNFKRLSRLTGINIEIRLLATKASLIRAIPTYASGGIAKVCTAERQELILPKRIL